MSLTPGERKVLLKYKNKKVRAVEKPFIMELNPLSGEPLKFVTANLTPNEQVIATRLVRKGHLCCSKYIHRLRVSKKGLDALKRR